MKKIKIITIISFIAAFLAGCSKDEAIDITPDNNQQQTDIGLKINEVLSTGDPDWVELFNSTNSDIDISNFDVSDSDEPKYKLPAGTIVPANGYYVILLDKTVTGFSLSSGGEEFYIWDTEGKLLDNIEFPELSDGISFGRSVDGGTSWQTMGATQGSANSTENNNPQIIAEEIDNVNDNGNYTYTVKVSDADGIREVMLYTDNGSSVDFIDMAPVGGGEYKCTIARMEAGTEVDYYVMATDETGLKSYFPSTAPEDMESFKVKDGYPEFLEYSISTENPAPDEDIVVTVKVHDINGFDDVRLYYVFDDQTAEDKEKVDMESLGDNKYTATIPGQTEGTVIRLYLRAQDLNGNKTYYPEETEDEDGNITSDFNHDDASTWPSFTTAPIEILEALVINEIQGSGSPDFIELYNGTNADMDISGYRLHDKDVDEAYVIPAGTTISADGFFVLDCDGDATTLFKVSSGGEDIVLLDTDGNVVDQLLEDNWPTGHSGLVGRPKDGAAIWAALEAETKGTTNNP